MSDVVDALARMAASTEFGLLTRQRLGDEGYDRSRVDDLVKQGRLYAAARGVYCLDPPGWFDRLCALVRVRFSGRTVVSHRSAARLHGLWDGDDLDLTVRYPARVKAAGASIHRSRDLVAGVLTTVAGLPVTTVARTLCDVGLVLPQPEVRRMVEHALATDAVSVAEIESVRWGVSEHGRTGVSAVDEALASLPRNVSSAESGPEIRLLALLEDADLPAVTPQLEVQAGQNVYRLDLAFPTAKVAIEYDGEAFHSTPDQKRRDAKRQANLERAGWLVLRFDRTDLYSPTNGTIIRSVADAIRDRRSKDL